MVVLVDFLSYNVTEANGEVFLWTRIVYSAG